MKFQSKSVNARTITPSMWKYFLYNMFGKGYCSFKGRASLKEYWGYMLFSIILRAIIVVLFGYIYLRYYATSYDEIESLIIIQIGLDVISLIFLIPDTAVLFRRFHDINMSGWWSLAVIPILFAIIYRGDKKDNRYGKSIY